MLICKFPEIFMGTNNDEPEKSPGIDLQPKKSLKYTLI